MSCGHRGAAGGATLQPVTRSRPWTGFARRNGVPGCEGSLPSRGREPSRRILLRILPAPGACGRPQLQLRTLAASRCSPRGARHLSPHTLHSANRSPSQAAPPTVSRAGRPRPAHTRCPWCAAVPNWPVPGARCPVPSAQGRVSSAQCPVPSAECPVPCALIMPSAVCAPRPPCPLCPNAHDAQLLPVVQCGARAHVWAPVNPYECTTADVCDGRAWQAAMACLAFEEPCLCAVRVGGAE